MCDLCLKQWKWRDKVNHMHIAGTNHITMGLSFYGFKFQLSYSVFHNFISPPHYASTISVYPDIGVMSTNHLDQKSKNVAQKIWLE